MCQRNRYETIYSKHCQKSLAWLSTFLWSCGCCKVINHFCSSDLLIYGQTLEFLWKVSCKLKKMQFFQGLFNLFSNLFNRTRSPTPLASAFWVHVQQLSRSSPKFTAHYICRRQRASNASISQKVISKQRPQVQLRQSIESSWHTFVIKVSFEIETFAGCHHAHKYQEDNQKTNEGQLKPLRSLSCSRGDGSRLNAARWGWRVTTHYHEWHLAGAWSAGQMRLETLRMGLNVKWISKRE